MLVGATGPETPEFCGRLVDDMAEAQYVYLSMCIWWYTGTQIKVL